MTINPLQTNTAVKRCHAVCVAERSPLALSNVVRKQHICSLEHQTLSHALIAVGQPSLLAVTRADQHKWALSAAFGTVKTGRAVKPVP